MDLAAHPVDPAPRLAEKAARRVAFLAAAPEARAHTGGYFERGQVPRRLSVRELDTGRWERAWQLGRQLVEQAPTRVTGTAR